MFIANNYANVKNVKRGNSFETNKMIIVYLLLVINLVGTLWLINEYFVKKLDNEIPPTPNSEYMESQHLNCYYKDGKLKKYERKK